MTVVSSQWSVVSKKTGAKFIAGGFLGFLFWLLITVLLITVPTVEVQQPKKVPRIAWITGSSYLSGDTGITAEQELVVRRHHGANLVVMSVAGAPNMTGPSEAAFVVNDLVRPNSVIVTHVNEAATVNGKVVPTSKTAAFQKAVTVPVHVPLSGKTMEFDGSGRCSSNC